MNSLSTWYHRPSHSPAYDAQPLPRLQQHAFWLLALLLSLFLPALAFAQSTNYTLTSVNVPGAATGSTIVFGINGSGQMVGQYQDSGGVTHGFLDSSGSFTTLTYPSATSTTAVGINSSGVVSGHYVDSSGNNHGFTYSGGTFSAINVTGITGITAAAGTTIAYGINDSGVVVGRFGDTSGHTHGFVDTGGTFTAVDYPGTPFTVATGINNTGQITGFYSDPSTSLFSGFLDVSGSFTSITYPSAQSETWGINNSGVIVGNSPTTAGFIYNGGTYTLIVPQTSATVSVFGINSSNTIVGIWSTGVASGFIGTPTGGSLPRSNAKNNGQGCECTGNPVRGEPVTVGNGNLFEHLTDYTTTGQNPLAFTRYYNSTAINSTTLATELGVNWRSNFDRYLQLSPATVIVERADGQQLTFTLSGSTWTTDSDVDTTLTNSGSTWTLVDRDDVTETYTAISSSEAQLNTIAARNGYTQTMHYNGSNQLTSVTDSYSRHLTLAYNTNGTLATVATPDSTTITYGYTAVGSGHNLTSVTFPTSPTSTVTYAYGASSAPPSALTSIVDENSNTYATWTYDGQSRVTSSKLGTSANTTTFTYNSGGTVTVQNALGVQDTYTFTTLQFIPKVTQISRAATGTTVAATETFGYDSNGYLASKTDWNGNQTTFTNNSHGLPTTINEAVSSSVARTTTIAYNSTFVHLPATITTPGVTTTFTYDGSGNELTRTLTDTTSTSVPYSTNGQTRTWTNTWSSFLLATTKTPNNNTTTYGYGSDGALTSITDALSHVASITSHTGGGRPLTIVDPNGATNGMTTTFTYDARQRLIGRAVASSAGTHTTTYTLDPAGNLTKVTLPDSSYIQYVYDTAHRATKATNALGEYQTYTLDALGDKTQINTFDSSNAQWRQQSQTFDALGRQLTYVGGGGLNTTTYTYDKDGNTLTVKDGNNHTTTRTFDALNRLSTVTDANSGVTQFAYDAHDRATSITDANSHVTTSVYNGFGDTIQTASPDSGTTVFHFDADSNVTQTVDGAGVTANMTYDALDRISTRYFPADSSQNLDYAYDQSGYPFSNNEIGRVSWIGDAAGYMYFHYDPFGNVDRRERTNSSNVDINDIYIAYDAMNRVSGTAYPSGLWVAQNRDAVGQVGNINICPPGSSTCSDVDWSANAPFFGPLRGYTLANSSSSFYNQDQDYRADHFTVQQHNFTTTLVNETLTYDAANNLTGVSDSLNTFNNQTLGYDVINRLTSATSGTGGYGSLAWTYDSGGNLTSRTVNSSTTTYGYTSGTNVRVR